MLKKSILWSILVLPTVVLAQSGKTEKGKNKINSAVDSIKVDSTKSYVLSTANVVANRTTIPSSTLRLGENLLVTPQNIQVIDQRLLQDQMILTTAEGLSRNVSGVRTITHQEEGSVGIAVRGFQASNLRNGMDVSGSFGPLREDMAFVS